MHKLKCLDTKQYNAEFRGSALFALSSGMTCYKPELVKEMTQTKMAWEKNYDDGSGTEYAIRFDGLAREGKGEIEFESVDSVTFNLEDVDWMIECLTKIQKEQGL